MEKNYFLAIVSSKRGAASNGDECVVKVDKGEACLAREKIKKFKPFINPKLKCISNL